MDGAEVGVLHEPGNEGFGRLLQGEQSLALKAEIRIVLSANAADEALEGCHREEQADGLLVVADLSQGNRAWLELSVTPLLLLDYFLWLRVWLGGRIGLIWMTAASLVLLGCNFCFWHSFE